MAGQDVGAENVGSDDLPVSLADFKIDFDGEGVFASVFLEHVWGGTAVLQMTKSSCVPRWASTRPTQSGTVAAGRSVYATTCSRCHGAAGGGGGPGGTVPTLRNYEGGQEKFLRIVENGRAGTPMAPCKGILTREEILSVYRYLTSLPPQ